MRVADANQATLEARLAGSGLGLDLGAAAIRIRSDVPDLARLLRTLYGSYRIRDELELFDVTVNLRRAGGLRQPVRPQVELIVDGAIEFEPFPLDTPMPLLEWGMNYALA